MRSIHVITHKQANQEVATPGSMVVSVRATTDPCSQLRRIDAEKRSYYLRIAIFVGVSTTLSIFALLTQANLARANLSMWQIAKACLLSITIYTVGGLVVSTYKDLSRRFSLPKGERGFSFLYVAWVLFACGFVTLLNGSGTAVGVAELIGSDTIHLAQELEVKDASASREAKRALTAISSSIQILEEDRVSLRAALERETTGKNPGYGPRAKEVDTRLRAVNEELKSLILKRSEAQSLVDTVANELAKAQSNIQGTGLLLGLGGASFALIPFLIGLVLAIALDIVGPVHSTVRLAQLYGEERQLVEKIGKLRFQVIEEEQSRQRSVLARWLAALVSV